MGFDAMKMCYAPYSNFHVAANVIGERGDGSYHRYEGANIENASYGGCSCAERTGIANAILHGDREIKCIVVCGKLAQNEEFDKYVWPCGICRQVIYEFCPKDGDIEIISVTKQGGRVKPAHTTIRSLLPHPFGPQDLGVDPSA